MRLLRFLLLVCVLSWSTPLFALQTIVYDATSGQTGEGTTSVTFNATIAASSNIAVVCVGTRENGGDPVQASGVTLGGQAMDIYSHQNTGGGNLTAVDLWYLLSPPTGTQEVVATGGAGADFMSAGVMAFSGVAQSDTWNTVSKHAAASNNLNVNNIPSAVGEMGVLCAATRPDDLGVDPDATSPVSSESFAHTHTGVNAVMTIGYYEAGAADLDMFIDLTGVVTYYAVVAGSMRQAPDASASGPLRRRLP